jgi:ABC-type amino acid transport substrate-binding protein
MMKRFVMAALTVAAMIGASHVANADALDDIKKSGKIRIAIGPTAELFAQPRTAEFAQFIASEL